MNRRNFITAATAGYCSFGYLSAADIKKVADKAKAKSVIYLFAQGGLSQLDSFNVIDPKKELLAKSQPIDSSLKGFKVSHFFPKMAKEIDKCTVINSMHTDSGAHPPAIYKALTSYKPRASIIHPQLGAWTSKMMTKPEDDIPNFININAGSQGSSGFFPGRYGALPVLNPSEGIRFIGRHKAVKEESFEQRLELMEAFNEEFENKFGNKETEAYSDSYKNAVRFMNSKNIDAFDISKEDKKIKALYGKDKFSLGCLQAVRLVEKGVKYINVTSGGWDHHNDIYTKFPKMASELDHGMAALLQHLELKGLLDQTLVVLASEFGRKVDVNATKGRDHQPKGFTCLLAGAGINKGNIYGKITPDGKDIKENPVDIQDLNATIAYAMGLSLEHEEKSPSGRPFKIANKGKALTQLF